MIRIDLENHFYAPCLIDALAQRSQPPFYDRATDQIHWTEDVCMPQGELLQRLLEVGEHRLSLLEQQGITHAVLSCSPGAEQLEPAKSIAVCQATNAALYELTRAHPGRLFGSAILPVKDVAAAERELERCVKEYGFVSWHTHSNYGNTAPDDPRYLPLFRKAAELGVYVYLHPQLPEGSRYAGYGFTFAGPGLGFTVDTVTTLLRMVVSGRYWDTWARGFPFCWTVLKTGSNFCPIRPFAAAARCATTFSTTSGLLPAAICRRRLSAVPRMCWVWTTFSLQATTPMSPWRT